MNELVQTNFISVTYRIGGLSGYKLTNIRVDEDTGSVVTPRFFDGSIINDIPPHKRNVNTVFQKYALFTHMNIAENIAFGLKIKGKSKADILL